MKDKKSKQLILTLSQELYDKICGRSKVKNITVLAEIRELLMTGINVESKNDDIGQLIRKINSYDYQLAKISSMVKLNYDLTVQEFCNKGYAGNKDPRKDHIYQDFLNTRKRDTMND